MSRRFIVLVLTVVAVFIYYVGRSKASEQECNRRIFECLTHAQINSENIKVSAAEGQGDPKMFSQAKWCLGRDKDEILAYIKVFNCPSKELDFRAFSQTIDEFCAAMKNDTPSDYLGQARAILHKDVEDQIRIMKGRYELLVTQTSPLSALYDIVATVIPLWSAFLSILLFFLGAAPRKPSEHLQPVEPAMQRPA